MCNVDMARRKEVSRDVFAQLMGEAAESGSYRLPRREGSDHVTTVPGMTATVMTRLRSFEERGDRTRNATDPELLTQAEIEGRRQALEYVRFLRDKVPGYQSAALAGFGTQIGIRETRRVYGDHRLTRDEVLHAQQFEDQIGLCGAPIEDHKDGASTHWSYLPDGKCVGIPFRTLLPQKIENVLVAGRCFSATHDAHASVRSMAQCMAMGQAAGTAAALSLSHRDAVREVPLAVLLDKLRASGAVLE
jgi:FAD dependent oxidoreductase